MRLWFTKNRTMLSRICKPKMAMGLTVSYPPAAFASMRLPSVLSICRKSSKSNGGSDVPATFAMEPFKGQMTRTLDACRKALSELKVSRSDPSMFLDFKLGLGRSN